MPDLYVPPVIIDDDGTVHAARADARERFMYHRKCDTKFLALPSEEERKVNCIQCLVLENL